MKQWVVVLAALLAMSFMVSLFLVLWVWLLPIWFDEDEKVDITQTRFSRDPWLAGVPKSTPVEQRDARPGSMVDQIVGRADTTMRNSDISTSIDIDILHRIARDWYKRIKMHEVDVEEPIQIEANNEGLKITLYHGDEFPVFENGSNELTNYGNSVMQRMSWLFARHVLTFTVDAHTSHDETGSRYVSDKADLLNLTSAEHDARRALSAFKMSLEQADEALGALVYYSDGELAPKVESVIGHGYTKPNKRFPNRQEKNRRVEFTLKLDMSKANLQHYKSLPAVPQ